MYEEDQQPVLRCDRCNKPFDKQATLKRHGYYCRSRKVKSVTRVRSCVACAKGKVRCDTTRPKCLRCASKGIDCQYTADTTTEPESSTRASRAARTSSSAAGHAVQPSTAGPSLGADVEIASSISPDPFSRAVVRTNAETLNFADPILDWNATPIDFSNFLSPGASEGNIEMLPWEQSSLAPYSGASFSQALPAQSRVLSPIGPSSIGPTPSYTVRSLFKRPEIKLGAQRIANLMNHTLKSYPLMMLNTDNLPPFIHPKQLSSELEIEGMEALDNCVNLVYMVNSNLRGRRKLFWKTVRRECERFCTDVLRFSKWELLAAMQSLAIYLIMRMDEGETEDNDFDYVLITAIITLAQQLGSVDNSQPTPGNSRLQSTWLDWIFEESRHRMCVFFRAINLLVTFEPAQLCQLAKDLVMAPLPAKKGLWEASNEFMWQVQTNHEPIQHTAYALATTGDLFKFKDANPPRSRFVPECKMLNEEQMTKTSANWEEWCTGMDGFGSLVMLAASLTA